MSAVPRSNDLGIIFNKTGTGAGTFTDISGRTQPIGTLTTSYTEQVTAPTDLAQPHVGAAPALSLFVDITKGSATSFKLKLQGRYNASSPWADLQTVREDTGGVAAEQTFVAAGTYVLQTSSALTMDQIRVLAAATAVSPLEVFDSVVVKGRVA